MILSIKTKLCGWEGIGPSEEAPGGVLLNGHGSHEMPSKSRCLYIPIVSASAPAWEASFYRGLQLLQTRGCKKIAMVMVALQPGAQP